VEGGSLAEAGLDGYSGDLLAGGGYLVSGIWYLVSGIGYRVSGVRYRVSGVGCRVSGIGYQVSGIECRMQGRCLPRLPDAGRDFRALPSVFSPGLRQRCFALLPKCRVRRNLLIRSFGSRGRQRRSALPLKNTLGRPSPQPPLPRFACPTRFTYWNIHRIPSFLAIESHFRPYLRRLRQHVAMTDQVSV
jgi:hypothetical protein